MSTLLKRKHVLAVSRSVSVPFNGLVSTANLVSYWKLNETSGQRNDSFGTNHLTPTNSPTSAVGKVGNACSLNGTTQYLSYSDPTPVGPVSFTYTIWFKGNALGAANSTLICKKDGTNNTHQIFVGPSGYHYFDFFLFGSVRSRLYSPASLDTNWHFLVAWYDSVAQSINLSIDNLNFGSGALGEPGLIVSAPTPPASNIPVRIGASGVAGEDFFNGLIDEVGLWKRVLTVAERTALYNSGNGLTF